MKKTSITNHYREDIVFIINDNTYFYPNRNQLITKRNKNTRITSINAPASRCLQILLMNPGKIISREFFFEEVWGKKGVIVSQNTYYQNISILRKALRETGLTEKFIVTVPHKGLTLNKTLKVRTCEKNKLLNIDNLSFIQEEKAAHSNDNETEDDVHINGPEKNKLIYVIINTLILIVLVAYLSTTFLSTS
ncbi:winged helix-turn-helix domain-containing protein [Pantoea sp. FN060301]|uniref:winged helix-turn-helix domain-containing protein n=1 Tax=Pantoea sp. FN060301 TaxID=3420380 RepID=UPI003D164CC6